MKGMKRMADWRTIQVFLSAHAAGIFEVEAETNTKETRCNCPVFKKQDSCKHVIFVNRKMKYNNGNYAIQVPHEVSEEKAVEAALGDPKDFREFVLKYAKIEVL